MNILIGVLLEKTTFSFLFYFLVLSGVVDVTNRGEVPKTERET